MAINSDRFRLALDRIGPGDWEIFEQLSSTFLASEYPSLRTMASPSGDGGRDSILYSEDGDETLAFQYSVTEQWSPKIKKTISRLKETFPKTNSLIYLTNRSIGAEADSLKSELRKKGYYLDVYDKSWFVERANSNAAREAAAEELSARFVDPLLPRKALDNDLVSSFQGDEAKTALIFLEMQIQDSSSSYGLTKSSYDALTRAALRGTNTSCRMTRQEVVNAIRAFLPSHPEIVVEQRVTAALNRLSGKAIRHRKDNDEFHLTDDEIVRLSGSIATIANMKEEFDKDLLSELVNIESITIDRPEKFTESARNIVQTYFFKKGEDFARSAIIEKPHVFDSITLKDVVIEKSFIDFGISTGNKIITMTDVLESVLGSPTENTAKYLKNLLESYTLFAFLAATPDVQKATTRMFSSGEIWLDTSVILPLLAESGASSSQMYFTQIYKQCISAGLRLYVTAGVLEEVERHINKCFIFTRTDIWEGPVPFLIASFMRLGGKETQFSAWAENFVGKNDPIQDIADYLRANHGIRLESAQDHRHVDEELASSIRTEWQNIHISRRSSFNRDTTHALRLASHDSEMFLHVLSSRINERGKAPLGYSDWWLTLDGSARNILNRIDPELMPSINTGPVLSLDYLLRYLAFGPNREKVDLTGAALSKVYADALIEPLPVDMIETLEMIRAENLDVPEAIVQRRIRDRLNDERSRMGVIDSSGYDNLEAMRDSY